MTSFEGRPDVDIQALYSTIIGCETAMNSRFQLNNALLEANPEGTGPLRPVNLVFDYLSFCPSRQQIRRRPAV